MALVEMNITNSKIKEKDGKKETYSSLIIHQLYLFVVAACLSLSNLMMPQAPGPELIIASLAETFPDLRMANMARDISRQCLQLHQVL